MNNEKRKTIETAAMRIAASGLPVDAKTAEKLRAILAAPTPTVAKKES